MKAHRSNAANGADGVRGDAHRGGSQEFILQGCSHPHASPGGAADGDRLIWAASRGHPDEARFLGKLTAEAQGITVYAMPRSPSRFSPPRPGEAGPW